MSGKTSRPAAALRRIALVTSVSVLPLHAAAAQDRGGTMELAPVTVEGSAERATGPAPGLVAKRSATGTKTDTPVLETPQAVSVITADQIRQQAAATTSEVLRYTPGVNAEIFGADPRADWPRVRGFQVPEFLDGLKLPRATYAWPRVDPYMLERLEVLKGPASVLYGQTPPGGLINGVSKRPTRDPVREVQFQVGDPGRLQAAFDFGGALDAEGTFTYRLTGLGRLAETQVDYVDDDRAVIAPAFTWRPNERTSLTVLGHSITDSGGSLQFLPSEGTLLPNPNGKIPRDRFLGEPGYDDFSRRQWAAGYLFETQLNDALTLRQGLRYASVDYDLDVVRGFGLVKNAAGQPTDYRSVVRRAVAIRDHAKALTIDNAVTGRFETGPLAHTVTAGVDILRQTVDYRFGAILVSPLDIYNPRYGTVPGTPVTTASTAQTLYQTGAYVQDQIALGGFRLTLSGRYDKFEVDTRNRLNSTTSTVEDSAFTGRAGLLYAFENGFSPYVSYATSFEPELGTNAAGAPFAPTEGRQVEAGLKYQIPGTNSLLTLSAFDLVQQNLVVRNALTNSAEQVGEVTVRGVELEGKINLWKGWDLLASYAYSHSEVTHATDGTEGNRVPYVPRHQASAWLNHTVSSGPLDGLSVGGGVRYVGASFGDLRNTAEAPSYTLFDAAVRVDLKAVSPALAGAEFAVNAANIFDKTYVSSCNDLNSCYWGTGRTIRGTLTYRW